MICKCEDYKKEIETVFAPLLLQVARNPQNFKKDKDGVIQAYEGKLFKYCPWCGEELL